MDGGGFLIATDEQIIEAIHEAILHQADDADQARAAFAAAKPLIREQALREAAKVAYEKMKHYADEGERVEDDSGKARYWAGANRAAHDVSAAILALIPEPPHV